MYLRKSRGGLASIESLMIDFIATDGRATALSTLSGKLNFLNLDAWHLDSLHTLQDIPPHISSGVKI